MVILVPFWEIINGQIGHQNNGVEMKFWEFCMILEYFSLGKGHFTRPRGRLEKSLMQFLLSTCQNEIWKDRDKSHQLLCRAMAFGELHIPNVCNLIQNKI